MSVRVRPAAPQQNHKTLSYPLYMMYSENPENNPKQLMQLAKNGDTEAFGQLYELYFTPVYRYIYLRTKSKEEAEDLAQVVFVKIFKSIGSFQEQNKPPLAYFFTIARNTVIDHWRKKKEILVDTPIETDVAIEEQTDSPIDLIDKKANAQVIHKAIETLTEDQQEVIILKFINDLTTVEIAKILEKKEDAIRQLQCRALKILKQYFKEHGL